HLLVVRRHCSHLLTDEAYLSVRKDRHVVKPASDFQTRAIRAGHDGTHTGESQSFARVDSLDLSRRDRAAQQFSPEHPRKRNVNRINGITVSLQLPFDSRCWVAADLLC